MQWILDCMRSAGALVFLESQPKFEILLLWMMVMFKPRLRALRINLSWKFKHQGPPLSLLHHETALAKFDSSVSFINQNCSLAKEIDVWYCSVNGKHLGIIDFLLGIGKEKRVHVSYTLIRVSMTRVEFKFELARLDSLAFRVELTRVECWSSIGRALTKSSFERINCK